MIDEMVRTAKKRRWNRTLAAIALASLAGSFVFSSVETGLLAGVIGGTLVWFFGSREVNRLTAIQKPWRNR
jgi:hypothetical protein